MGMDLALKAKLQKQRYHIVGEHGGVKVCHWTKESLQRSPMLQSYTVLQVTIACKLLQLSTSVISLVPIAGDT